MIRIEKHGEVSQILMARDIDGQPVYTMACYFIDGLMIDTGPYHVNQELAKVITAFNIKQIVNTHHHEDHIGNNRLLLDIYNLPGVFAHEKAAPLIENPQLWIHQLKPYQLFAWGEPEPSPALVIGDEIVTDKYSFKVIHTPGHSADHICLLEATQGWLFGGDMYITDKPAVTRSDENVNLIITSIGEILKHDFNTIFCASGKIVENGKQAMQQRYDNFVKIRESVLSMYREGHSPESIMKTVLGKETILYEPTSGDMAKINLVNSLISEL